MWCLEHFASGWKNAEAHLIVLVLEALNLVLEHMPGYVCSVTPTCHQLLVQCRSVWRILVSCWSLSAATVHAAHQLVPPVLKRKRQTREENIRYRFTVHHRCKRYYLDTQNRNAVFWICKLPHKSLDCKVCICTYTSNNNSQQHTLNIIWSLFLLYIMY